MLRPKYVPPLLLFALQCLHFPSSLVNFVLMPANPRPHEGVRFLLEKSIISISAIDKLQSIREIFCRFSCLCGFKPKQECFYKRNFNNKVDQILPKLFGWTANCTLGSVLLCSGYAIVVLLIVLYF